MALPYLKGASAGGGIYSGPGGRSGDRPYSAEYSAQLRAEGAEQAKRQQEGGVKGLSASSTGSPFQLRGVQERYMKNLNPMYVGGRATVKLGGGEEIEIPNALAQQISFQAGVNQGRWNPEEAFGSRQVAMREAREEGSTQYKDYGVLRQSMEKAISTIPGLATSGQLLGQVGARLSRLEELDTKIRGIMGSITSGGNIETGGVGGITGGSYVDRVKALEAYKREQQQAVGGGGGIGGPEMRKLYEEQGGMMSGLMKLLKDYVPATSNLEIKEQVA